MRIRWYPGSKALPGMIICASGHVVAERRTWEGALRALAKLKRDGHRCAAGEDCPDRQGPYR